MKSTTINSCIMTIQKTVLLPILVGFIFIGCSKSDTPQPDPEPEPPTAENMFNTLITVKNFGEALSQGSEPTTKQSPIYFSLESKQGINPDYKQTARWDLSFDDIYRSFLNCNTPLRGGTGKGGILIVKQKFDDVTDVPADNLFRTGEKSYGTDDSGAFGEGLGWYLYDFGGTIKGGSDPRKAHVCYPIEGHTIIVRTAKGNYAKVRIQSIYKDLLDPKDWYKDSPTPYFTFQYVLVKAGSKTFEIKK